MLVGLVANSTSSKDIRRLTTLAQALAERADAGQLTAEDYEDGTFTVANLGANGVDGLTPIINLPQVAILGVGAMRRVPVVDEGGGVCARQQIVLSLTFDS